MKDPIIILGAGRSGTNILRDVLTSFEGSATWPCDEINYIWRHGNRDFPTDEFPEELARPKVADFIRGEFHKLSRRKGGAVVVEKTCANTLRVPFVCKIFPNAMFIHLLRDGRDVAVSASERWKASLDIGYLLQKARYVPKSDLLYYASRYFMNHVHRFTSGKKRVATWGPRFEGMQDAFAGKPIEVACAIQWQRCVELSSLALERIPEDQVYTLTYEDLTARPEEEFAKLLKFVGFSADVDIEARVSRISARSVGRWRSSESSDEFKQVIEEIGDTLKKFGYDS